MGKGDRRTKAKNNRRKMANAVAGFDLPDVPRRQPNGQARQRTEGATDPRKTALQARCRIAGKPDTLKDRLALSGQHSGSQIGLVMQHMLTPRETADLWQTYQAWCTAEATYRRRYLGQGEFAKGASIKAVPERMETDTSHTVDLRTSDEKDADAVTSWMRWQGQLGMIEADQRTALHDARLERAVLWADAAPTQRGIQAVRALQALHLVVGRKKSR